MTAAARATHCAWIDEADLRLDDFRAQVLRITDRAEYPMATDVRSNVPVYSASTVANARSPASRLGSSPRLARPTIAPRTTMVAVV